VTRVTNSCRWLTAAIVCAQFFFASVALAGNDTIPCAIRWDAFDTGLSNSINKDVTRTLSPAIYWSRAPWYSVPNGANSMIIDGDIQAIMDQEIRYAHDAGLTCWVYLWYGVNHPMQNAWRLHQASSIKNEVNWAQMLPFGAIHGPGGFSQLTPEIISYMRQQNYQRVVNDRPLWFLFDDGGYKTELPGYWGNNPAEFATALLRFRAAVQAAGLPNPYIVMLDGGADGNAATAASLGADAVSNYIPDFGAEARAKPWAKVAASISSYWKRLGSSASAHGIKVVPIAATGWDTRPRKQNVVSWEVATRPPNEDLSVYDVLPTPRELTVELQSSVSYVTNNPKIADSKVVLIYAWDECDEGGNCLIPHYNPAAPGVPDTRILNAFRDVHW